MSLPVVSVPHAVLYVSFGSMASQFTELPPEVSGWTSIQEASFRGSKLKVLPMYVLPVVPRRQSETL